MKEPHRKLIGVDIDETLCKEVCWTPADVRKATPVKKTIKKVNALYEDNFIVIYTARRDRLMSDTYTWLKDNGVRFHAVSNVKIPLDILLDTTLSGAGPKYRRRGGCGSKLEKLEKLKKLEKLEKQKRLEKELAQWKREKEIQGS